MNPTNKGYYSFVFRFRNKDKVIIDRIRLVGRIENARKAKVEIIKFLQRDTKWKLPSSPFLSDEGERKDYE